MTHKGCKLTALDMTPLGWLGRKTSTQTNKHKPSIVNVSKNILIFILLPENILCGMSQRKWSSWNVIPCFLKNVLKCCQGIFKFSILIFTTLNANSADDKLMIYFLFFPENRIWQDLKCQILFSGKNKKKYFKMSSAENFCQSAKR